LEEEVTDSDDVSRVYFKIKSGLYLEKTPEMTHLGLF
jgi:hypothetical protein